MRDHERLIAANLTNEHFHRLYTDLAELAEKYGQEATLTALTAANSSSNETIFIASKPELPLLEVSRVRFATAGAMEAAYEAAGEWDDLSKFLIEYAPQTPHLIRLFSGGGYDVRRLTDDAQELTGDDVFRELSIPLKP